MGAVDGLLRFFLHTACTAPQHGFHRIFPDFRKAADKLLLGHKTGYPVFRHAADIPIFCGIPAPTLPPDIGGGTDAGLPPVAPADPEPAPPEEDFEKPGWL